MDWLGFALLGSDGLPNPALIGGIYGLLEVALAVWRRSRGGVARRDRHSWFVLWGSILTGVAASICVANAFPDARWPYRREIYLVGLTLFIAAVLFRWWAIQVLGRFFTVDVAIAADHRVVTSGPYRFVRHPSYTGVLFAFVGYGLCLGNYWALIALLLPVTAGFLWRIKVEEAALLAALGNEYAAYAARTKRLVPFLY